MTILSSIKSFFSTQPVKQDVPVVFIDKGWRTGMWVMVDGQIGILFKLGDPCSIHLVNPQTGETTSEEMIPIGKLRQARFGEIPQCRRHFTEQRALELGYGP
jgi:hypothetical protein